VCVELRSVTSVTADDSAELLGTLICLSVAPASDVTADDVIELLSLGRLDRSPFTPSSGPLQSHDSHFSQTLHYTCPHYLRHGGYVIVVVCLYVCLSATVRKKFSGKVRPMNMWLSFGGDSDHRLDTGIVFRIRHRIGRYGVVNGHSFILIRHMAALVRLVTG